MDPLDFDSAFAALTGNSPFPWQRALYRQFIANPFDNIPSSCNLPTGLGKTSVIAIWLIALANYPAKMPRRLVYVVNRRTVVDQTTNEVKKYRDKLAAAGLSPVLEGMCCIDLEDNESPMAISTLRGQFADNREWSADPSRPAVICGTVDMIGSRLLFSGYGMGFKMKPLHAGFLGQDVLLIHDEAHLEPAFQDLVAAVEVEQSRCGELKKFKVMELSATSRRGGAPFGLTEEDRKQVEVGKRINAPKALTLHQNSDEKQLAEKIAKLALTFKELKCAVLVFVRKVEDVEKIVKKLPKDRTRQLTGTLRGLERDQLIDDAIFKRFLPEVDAEDETVYLVCTSAGEVGVNISAAHMVSDLSTFESMAQRLGRVNRFGQRNDTQVHVVHPVSFGKEGNIEEFDLRRQRTLALLRLLKGDASPYALSALDETKRREAFAPEPTILQTSDILFDCWGLTSIREKLPGRPPVEPFLHGISENDPPQTTVAWRWEVEWLTEEILDANRFSPEDVLEAYPLKPHEQLTAPTYGRNKVFEQLEKVAARNAKLAPGKQVSAWIVDPDGTVTIQTLHELVRKDKQNKPLNSLSGRTVILSPHSGGLEGGLLMGESAFAAGVDYDVSDQWYADEEKTIPRRLRVRSDDANPRPLRKMRLAITFDLKPDAEDTDDGDAELQHSREEGEIMTRHGRYWHWYVRPKSADDDGSKTADVPITLHHHTCDVEVQAAKFADSLLRDRPELHKALVLAARFHDLGKRREIWQRSIGNPNPRNWHAKSGRDPVTNKFWRPLQITDYRHEFGSLADISDPRQPCDSLLRNESAETRELVLHLVAAHHGFGRPHFPADRAFDPEAPADIDPYAIAVEVPRRFARLQRRYGRWGLAYLESLLRAADHAASSNPSGFEKDGQT